MEEWEEDILINTTTKERDIFTWDEADVLL